MDGALLNIGIWQDSGTTGDVATNLSIIEKAAKQAGASNIELLIFPECFLTGYYQTTNIMELARSVDDNLIAELGRISKAEGVALVVGTYEIADDKLYNAALFVSPFGGLAAKYRKRALYGSWEQTTFSRGEGPTVVDYNGWRIGLLICFDIEFPELVRELAVQNVDIVVVPTALMEPYDNVAQKLVPTRALENQIFVAYANRIGHEHEFAYIGQSCIAGPMGETIALAPKETGCLLQAQINRDAKLKSQKFFTYVHELNLIRN